MRCVIQRVIHCSVKIGGSIHRKIENGLLIFAGFEDTESLADLEWMCSKILNMRIFPDENGLMNISVVQKNYSLMLVSQFTLHASTKKGNRPSFIKAASPQIAKTKYDEFVTLICKNYPSKIETGIFGADMKIELENDGPVTIIIDSKQRE